MVPHECTDLHLRTVRGTMRAMRFVKFCLTPATGAVMSTFNALALAPMLERCDRLVFLLSVEMTFWTRSRPTPSPNDLILWGSRWALQADTSLDVLVAQLVSLDAFLDVAQTHELVKDHLYELHMGVELRAYDAFVDEFEHFPPVGIEENLRHLSHYLTRAADTVEMLIRGVPPADTDVGYRAKIQAYVSRMRLHK